MQLLICLWLSADLHVHTCQPNSKGMSASLPLLPPPWQPACPVVFLIDSNKQTVFELPSQIISLITPRTQSGNLNVSGNLCGTPIKASQIWDKNFKQAFVLNIWETPS